jgi:hypothetical protein
MSFNLARRQFQQRLAEIRRPNQAERLRWWQHAGGRSPWRRTTAHNENMSSPFQPGQVPGAASGTPAGSRRAPGLPIPPKGWPVGSYPTYAEAQRAVDYLSDQQFPVQEVTIVGVDLMQVERVTGRLTWPKVLGGGVISGAWLGLFIGLVLTLLFSSPHPLEALTTGLVAGVFFGLITSAIPYSMARGTRDFSSTLQLVAGRYDVLCDPKNAEKARDLLARLAI